MAKIAPFGRYRAFDANGKPLSGGKLYTYEAGTSTPKDTYTGSGGTTKNPNPVVLDANGYADVWLDIGGYKFILRDSADNLLWTVDNIDGGGAAGFGSQVISKSASFSLTVNEQNSVIICTQPITVSLMSAAVAGSGYIAVVVNASSGNVTVAANGSETINGASSLVIPANNSATIHSNGIAWFTSGYSARAGSAVWRVQDGADVTKLLAIDISAITTNTTRTLTIQNVNGTVFVSGGLDVPIADGGTGASDAPTAFTNLKQAATTSVSGVVSLAVASDVQTGTDAAKAVTAAAIKGALGVSRFFQSSQQAYPASLTPLVIPHGLPSQPIKYQVALYCAAADLGYSAGDELDIYGLGGPGGIYTSLSVDATNLRMTTNGSVQVPNKNTAVYATITPANWRVIFRAWV